MVGGTVWDVSSLTRGLDPSPYTGSRLSHRAPREIPSETFQPKFPSFPPMRRIPLAGFFRRALALCPNAGAGVEPPPLLVVLSRPFPAVFQLWHLSCIIHTLRFGSVENQVLVGASHFGYPPPLPRRLRPSVPRARPWRLQGSGGLPGWHGTAPSAAAEAGP